MNDFFDRHPRFFETSTVGTWSQRLALRYEAIVDSNRDIFPNAKVLDLASHDGRWSYAALCAGAAHVTGIEARPELIAAADENMKHYGISEDKYRLCRVTLID
jgi:predicted RNA methylase